MTLPSRHSIAMALFLLIFSGATLAFEDAPPPPDINDRGVASGVQGASTGSPVDKPDMPDTRLVRDKATRARNARAAELASSSDSVTQRQEGDDVIREYRQKGILRMIRIKPARGPEQIYFDQNGDGRLERDAIDGPVAPVYFTIYEWN